MLSRDFSLQLNVVEEEEEGEEKYMMKIPASEKESSFRMELSKLTVVL
jgi:hypothetical protein